MDNWYRYWDLIRWHQLDKLYSTKYPNTMLCANVSNVPDCEESTNNGYIDASDAQIRTYEAKHYFYPIPTTLVSYTHLGVHFARNSTAYVGSTCCDIRIEILIL